MEIEDPDVSNTGDGSGVEVIPLDGEDPTPGLIRRVRRRARFSQRELAHELGVSQSAVAKWETGRTTPTARMLNAILRIGELRAVAVKPNGDCVQPMKSTAARDAGGRRYPAHTYVWAEGWWAPEGVEMTAWSSAIMARSAELELPKVRYSRAWRAWRRMTPADILDHPTWAELVAEARAEVWQPRRSRVRIPEWVLTDSKKSRNRSTVARFRAVPPRPGQLPTRPQAASEAPPAASETPGRIPGGSD